MLRLARRAACVLPLVLGAAGPLPPAPATVSAPVSAPNWRQYQVIYWQADGARIAAIPAAGGTAGRLTGFRAQLTPAMAAKAVAPFLAAGTGFYLENIATDFYSPYHRWRTGMAVNQAFLDVERAYAANPGDPAVLLRQPSLSDPDWQARIDARLAAHVRDFGRWHPLFYNLADESGIADLAAPWDFDFSPQSLAGFRTWLRGRYGDLAALNAQWGSSFADWDAVRPITTAQALREVDGNLSAWGDFKAWMDVAFARALRAGTAAVHRADPAALAGMEGAQLPGWGGYNYTRLAHAVDVMEIYETVRNLDLVHALNPDLVLLTTSFGGGPLETWRLWHTALLGARGSVVWDSAATFISDQGRVGPRARDLAPVLAELRGGVGALLALARPVPGPVGVLYSPASLRIAWLRDRIGDAGWAMRGSGDAGAYTAPLLATDQAASTLERLGMPARWLTPADLAGGVPAGLRAVVLPGSLALSDADIAALRRFAAGGGGLVLADTPPGRWDQHLRPRPTPLTQGVTLLPGFDRTHLAPALAAAGLTGAALLNEDGTAPRDVSVRAYRLGAARLIALQREQPDSGLRPAPPMTLTLDAPAWVRDVRGVTPAARQARVTVTLDPVTPTILALSDAPIAAPVLHAPQHRVAGQAAELDLESSAPVLQVEVLDPMGDRAPRYGGLVWPAAGHAAWHIPFASDERRGTWTVRVTDPLGGGEADAAIRLD